MKPLFVSFALCGALAAPAFAEGDPTRRGTRLEPLVLDAAQGFSQRRFELETGVYYRWRIESDGLEEYKLVAPEFFREIWVDQVVVEDKEVKPYGLHAVEFDDAGTIDVWFVPIRPGTYEFYVVGLEELGFRGEFVVR
ncbi:hypothetical protein GE300_11635 [Rhodobacteraceae bacterium 2CG4]|uniref:Copper-binding protein n=1 Tax=Halovulum marinum TaxID=2662447 RepID=A0A6L5Z121_9RHOB|nr:hypothetical protein [Halovulum marinum]MSU90263.1 hypothetical protein [Halovulum marinum]